MILVEEMQTQLGQLRKHIAAPGPLSVEDRNALGMHVQVVAGSLRVIHEALQLLFSESRTMTQPNVLLEAPRHSPECICTSCERCGSGFFAQRAALAGDAGAADRLSAPVFALLTNQRACLSWRLAVRLSRRRQERRS
jgi:hypothetical protein